MRTEFDRFVSCGVTVNEHTHSEMKCKRREWLASIDKRTFGISHKISLLFVLSICLHR